MKPESISHVHKNAGGTVINEGGDYIISEIIRGYIMRTKMAYSIFKNNAAVHNIIRSSYYNLRAANFKMEF